jgi:hypothetical protein
MGRDHGPAKQDWQRLRARTGQYDRSEASIQVAVRVCVGRGRKRSILIQRGHVDIAVTMIGGMAMTVRVPAVTVRLAMVMMARRRRHVMIGAQRSVRGKGKRRHDRQSGREASAQQLGVTNHVRTGSSRMARF